MNWKYAIYLGLGLLTSIHVFRLYQQMNINSQDMPIDARNLYLLVHTADKHDNFYLDKNFKRTWYEIAGKENFESNSPPGLPYSSILYPPQALTEFYFLKYIPWKNYRWINYGYNFLLILIIAFLVYQLSNKNLNALSILFPLIAFKGTWQAFFVGQPMFLCLTFILMAYYLWREKKHSSIAGVLLGLAAFKFTLVIPFGLFFLYKRDWKLIGTSVITVLLLLAPVVFQYDLGELLSAYGANAKEQIYQIYTDGGNNLLFQTTELASLLFSGGIISANSVSIFNGILLISGIVILIFNPKRYDDESTLLLIILWTFLFMYHLSYDGLVILAFLVILKFKSSSDFLKYLPFIMVFFLPINGIMRRLNLSWEIFYLHMPIAIFALLCYELFFKANQLQKQSIIQN